MAQNTVVQVSSLGMHQSSDLKDLFIYCSDKCNENMFRGLLYSQLLLVTDQFIRCLTRRNSV